MQLIMQTHEDHFIKTPRRDFHKLGYYRRQLLWQVLENLDPSSAGVWNRTIQAQSRRTMAANAKNLDPENQ